MTKVLDFGVAKAAGRLHTTREGNVKGKLPYMSPEQLRGGAAAASLQLAPLPGGGMLGWQGRA